MMNTFGSLLSGDAFSPTLVAFGFGNLLIMGWLAAAAAPLIIHLWNKRKYRETPWAAVEFLLAAVQKSARRFQIQEWLLLAVRTAIVVLVVLAVAQPFLERAGLEFSAGQRTHKVLVLDASYSMGYRPTDRSRFERAKQLAEQIVEESSQGDGFSLVLLSTPPRVIIGSPALQPRDFLDEIENVRLLHTGGDVPATLAAVREVLERAEEEHPGLARSEVYFLTDLGRTSWARHARGTPPAAQLESQVQELASKATLRVIDLGQEDSDNLAVTDLKTSEPFATAGRDVTFEAQVTNFGSQPARSLLVELLVDQVRVQQQYVDVEPRGQASLSFAHRFDTSGHHVVGLRLGAPLLEIDNRRWLALPVRPALEVLCVGGRQGSTRYLTRALDPYDSEQSLVRPRVVPESALLEMDLDQFDCIFLCNVAQFTPREARLLEAYLRQGGGLVFFLGDQVLRENYNRQLTGRPPGGALVIPVRLGEVVAENQYRLDPLDYRHPLVRAFRGSHGAGLLRTPISRYFRLEPLADENVEPASVALAFDGDDPAIVEAPLHGGRSIVVATAASDASIDAATRTPWTTMHAWPSFVPLVQELVALAVRSQSEQNNATVGQTLGAPLDYPDGDAALSVVLPDGRRRSAPIRSDADGLRWAFAETDESGVYWLEAGRAPAAAAEPGTDGGAEVAAGAIPYAVNVDTSESDLAKADPDELPANLVVQTDWQDLDQPALARITRRAGLHKLLLYTVLALLLAETFLAQRFGGRG